MKRAAHLWLAKYQVLGWQVLLVSWLVSSLVGVSLYASDDPQIKNIKIGDGGQISGTTATIDFTNFDVSSGGTMSLAGGINLSGDATAGAANVIDFESGTNDDLSASDVIDLTDGGETTLHSHAAADTLDTFYNNDTTGDAQITLERRDVSFNLNDATNDYKISIDNTTTAAIATALEISASGTGATITTAIDVSDADIVNALDLGPNVIFGTTPSFVTTSGNITFDPDGNGDVTVNTLNMIVQNDGTLTVNGIGNDSGSATAPSYTFNADTDTGFFLNAANDPRIIAGGSAGAVVILPTNPGGSNNDGILLNLSGTQTTNGLCHNNSGTGTQELLVDCSGTPGDLAEWYETEKNVEAGDLVVPSKRGVSFEGARLDEKNAVFSGGRHTLSILEKSTKPYEKHLFGVISTAPYQVMGEDLQDAGGVKHPLPLALSGRVLVKVSTENGGIKPGDPITSSSIPGVGMKATHSGPMVGIALETYEKSGVSKIMIALKREGSFISEENQRKMEEFGQKRREILALPSPALHKLASLLDRSEWSDEFRITEEKLMEGIGEAFIIDEALVMKEGEKGLKRLFQTEHFGERATYVDLSREAYFFERGEGKLKDGTAIIKLNPLFLEAVQISDEYPLIVRVTAASLDIKFPLIVSERTERSFTVTEANSGNSQAYFMWEVSGRKK